MPSNIKTAVIVFPASNCDRDVAVALEAATGTAPAMVWHGDSELPDGLDLIVLPGGFSFGDYLRVGAMAARSPIMAAVVAQAARGVSVLGICNGFQVLCEAGLLPGVLMRNASLQFVCRDVHLKVENSNTMVTQHYQQGEIVRIPVAHHDGNYVADADTLDALEAEGRVVLRYVTPTGEMTAAANPNGSQRNIAGITDPTGRIVGMMPHPERLADVALGGTDGRAMFDSAVAALA